MKARLLTLLVVFLSAGPEAAWLDPALLARMALADEHERLGVLFVLNRQFDAEHVIRTVKDKRERWSTTVAGLRELSAADQPGLLAELRSYESLDLVHDIRPFWIVNAVYCEATPAVIRAVAARPEVRLAQWDLIPTTNLLGVAPLAVDAAGPGSFPPPDVLFGTPAWNVKRVKADSVWLVHGCTGEGVVVGHIDTGCDYTHPDLAARMWTDRSYPLHGWNFFYRSNDPMDIDGHGTHTCGTVAGDGNGGTATGIAPEARAMILKAKLWLAPPLPDTVAENTVMDALQFCVAPPLSPDNHAHLATMSLGWMQEWTPRRAVWRQALANVVAAGLPVFVAAGNEAGATQPPYSVRTPGDCPGPWKHPAEAPGGLSGAITIGATDSLDFIAGFSSLGPVKWDTISPFFDYPMPAGLLRPDFSAPGAAVISTRMGGGYTTVSGTSMATPCAAGIAALMLSKNPFLLPEQIDSIMQNSVLPLGAQPKNNTYGTGRIDAMRCIANTPLPGQWHDVAVKKVLNPAERIEPLAPLAPSVVVRNRGTAAEPNVVFHCRVESLGRQVYYQTATRNLPPGGTDTVRFPDWTPGPGSQTYELKFWHSLTSDTNRSNDTIGASTKTRGHDIQAVRTNIWSRTRAAWTLSPKLTLKNDGEHAESGFSAFCRVDSAGVPVYLQSESVGNLPVGGTTRVTFPSWNVGPDSATYTVRLYHDCGTDQNRLNDTLNMVTTAWANMTRVAITIREMSHARTPPNAIYSLDSLCRVWGWRDTIVFGEQLALDPAVFDDCDVVVTGGTGEINDALDFRLYDEALLARVRSGGGFVGLGLIVHGVFYQGRNRPIDTLLPVSVQSSQRMVTSGTVHVLNTGHPTTEGVNSFPVHGYGEYAQAGLKPGAVSLADYSGAPGNSSVAYQSVGAGRSVYLGPTYFADFARYSGVSSYYTDANAVKLLKHAIEWAAWGDNGVGTNEPGPTAPLTATLSEPRPNPFSGRTVLSYCLPATTRVRLAVYDIAGREVRMLADGMEPAGQRQVGWNCTDERGRRLPGGVYIVRLKTDLFSTSCKLVLER